jgi:hypothetical protein
MFHLHVTLKVAGASSWVYLGICPELLGELRAGNLGCAPQPAGHLRRNQERPAEGRRLFGGVGVRLGLLLRGLALLRGRLVRGGVRLALLRGRLGLLGPGLLVVIAGGGSQRGAICVQPKVRGHTLGRVRGHALGRVLGG